MTLCVREILSRYSTDIVATLAILARRLIAIVARVRHVVDCTFTGRRIVIFSGRVALFDDDKLLDEFRLIHTGRRFGSIIGCNSFRRQVKEALWMRGAVMDIYTASPDRTRTH